MTIDRRNFIASVVGSASVPFSSTSWAQGGKLARMIVPFPAGGGTDLSARLLVDKMKDKYPGSLIVENRPGASGRLGVEYVKDSEPDGLTMLFVTDFVLTVFPYSFRKLNYSPLRDFAPVALCGTSAYALVAGPGLPSNVGDFREFAAWCKANPKIAAFGSTSAGSPSHFMGIMLSRAIGVNLLHIPYKGGAQALQGVMGGEVPITINPIGEVLPQLQGNKIRVFATTGEKRNPRIPNAQTLVEAGLKNAVVEFWGGVMLPARTPSGIVTRTAAIINDVLQRPEVRDSYAQASKEIVVKSPAEFSSLIRTDMERWSSLVKASGFAAED